MSEVEDLDGLALSQLIGESEVGHVGTTGRPVDREEAQTRRGNVIELGIGMGQQLVRLLRGCIEAHGVVHLVVG